MTGVHYHTQLLVEMGVLITFLPRLSSNHDPPNLCLLSSWDYRWEPVGPAPLTFVFLWVFFVFVFVLWYYWCLNSGPHACQAGILPLESLCQPSLELGIFKIESLKLFAQAGFGLISASWVARITSVSHQHPADFCFNEITLDFVWVLRAEQG
jgi:hypothetical protein